MHTNQTEAEAIDALLTWCEHMAEARGATHRQAALATLRVHYRTLLISNIELTMQLDSAQAKLSLLRADGVRA